MSKKPNIILILADDLGYGDLGCYGSEKNQSPNIDRLATEGTRFTDFYMASSICTPSRAGLLTGCYPQRISMNNVLFPGNAQGLNPEEKTIANMLKDNGYNTKIVGKWHCGDQPEFLPTNFGFDSYYGLPYSNDMGIQAGNDNNPFPPLPLIRDDEVIEQQPDQTGITERYVEESVRFIRDNAKSDTPFFLYLAHMYVHLPLYVPESFLRNSQNGRYGAAVACIDWAWSVIDNELRKLGLADDTIVIFTSDNGSRASEDGPNSGSGSNDPLRGNKFTTWEGGFRLPCIMRWPGKIPAAKVTDQIASSIDLLPTLASFTQASVPGENPIDGVDLSGFVLGQKDSSPRRSFVYMSHGNIAAVRQDRWKLHACRTAGWGKPFDPAPELYDLQNDIAEQSNVIDDNPEVVRELSQFLTEYRNTLGDKFTDTDPTQVRDCGISDDPKPLTTYDENHPYIIAEYDLSERG